MKCKKCGTEMERDRRHDWGDFFYTLNYGYSCPKCGHMAFKTRKEMPEEDK